MQLSQQGKKSCLNAHTHTTYVCVCLLLLMHKIETRVHAKVFRKAFIKCVHPKKETYELRRKYIERDFHIIYRYLLDGISVCVSAVCRSIHELARAAALHISLTYYAPFAVLIQSSSCLVCLNSNIGKHG